MKVKRLLLSVLSISGLLGGAAVGLSPQTRASECEHDECESGIWSEYCDSNGYQMTQCDSQSSSECTTEACDNNC